MFSRKNKMISLLLALLFTVLLPVKAQALGAVDPAKPVTLTIHYSCGGKAAKGAGFDLYRVAEISADGKFTLSGDFKGYSVSLDNSSAGQWRALAETLAGYVERDGLRPLDSGKTDRDGVLAFPTAGKTLQSGLYLALGEPYVDGRKTYTAEPFLVSLPGVGETGGQWQYDVTVVPKYTEKEDDGPDDDTIRRKVIKVWEDAGDTENRPDQVTVELLRNGRVYDTVTLNEENHWRYTWDGLDADDRWTVVEQDVPDGYTVTVSREGATFVVTNTKPPEIPTGPEGPDEPTPRRDPHDPDTPDYPHEPHEPDRPHEPDEPGEPGLPQTGVLWWPVPLLLAAGLALIVLGCFRRRDSDAE